MTQTIELEDYTLDSRFFKPYFFQQHTTHIHTHTGLRIPCTPTAAWFYKEIAPPEKNWDLPLPQAYTSGQRTRDGP